jgi:glycosyltransferase involved in cell wall biosynthesis/peptidoglycan/xylan/chitin deacetylase (PgdA/CDA1 family)
MTNISESICSVSSKTQKLRILFLVDQLDSIGGAERNLLQIVSFLIKEGHYPIVACFKGGAVSETIEKMGVQVENLFVGKVYNLRGLRAFTKLKQIIKRDGIDLIVTYHESSDFFGVVLALITRTPIISSRRDMGFQLKARHVWIYRLINPFFSHVVTVSSAVKEAIIKSQWCQRDKISVIYNGVGNNALVKSALDRKKLREQFGLGSDHRIICCLANIRPIKGQKYLIECAKLLSAKYPEARFVFLGRLNTSHSYFSEISDLVSRYQLKNVIDFRGKISPDKISNWLCASDISVLPSLSEGFSNTILESMAVGLPVVATEVGGNPEVIKDGVSGYLVPPGDSAALAEAIGKLLNEEFLRLEMGERGKQIIADGFTETLMIDKNLDIFRYVVWNHKRKKDRILSPMKHGWQKCIPVFFRHAKDIIATLSYRCGIYSLFLLYKRLLKLGKPRILSFHNISPGFPANYSSVEDPVIFEKQIDFLQKNYRIIALDEAVQILEKRTKLKTDVFALTFDDCYKGLYDYVLPVLKRYKIPATFFISSAPLTDGEYHAYDILMMYLEKTWKKSIDLSSFGLGIFYIDNDINKFYFTVIMSRFLRRKSISEQKHILLEVCSLLGLDPEYEKNMIQILDMNSFQELAASEYVTLGGHTVNHVDLSSMENFECEIEIKDNREFLQRYSDKPVNFFAYPFGNYPTRDFVVSSLKKYGYTHAFTLGGVNKKFNPYRIERYNLHSATCLGCKNRCSNPLMAIEISGLGDIVFLRAVINKIKNKLNANSTVY